MVGARVTDLLSAEQAEKVGAEAAAAGVNVPTTVLLGDSFGAMANALMVTAGVPNAPTEIGVVYFAEVVVGVSPFVV